MQVNQTGKDPTPHAHPGSPSAGLPSTQIPSWAPARGRSESSRTRLWRLLQPPPASDWSAERAALSQPANCMRSRAFEKLHSFDLLLLLTSDLLIQPLFAPAPRVILNLELAPWVPVSGSAVAHGSVLTAQGTLSVG